MGPHKRPKSTNPGEAINNNTLGNVGIPLEQRSQNNGIIGPDIHSIENKYILYGRLFFIDPKIDKRSQNMEQRRIHFLVMMVLRIGAESMASINPKIYFIKNKSNLYCNNFNKFISSSV